MHTIDYDSEKDILEEFNKVLAKYSSRRLVGFVNIGFDSPFVFKRMLLNGILPHDRIDSSGLKPWEVDEVDLAKEWQGTSFNRASLINIATAFGLPSPKEDISGADVGRVYWEEGREGLNRISKYCRRDVVATINIFKKMRLEEPLELAEEEVEEKEPLMLETLFAGGDYNKEVKEKLSDTLSTLSKEDRAKAFTILDSLVSTAKGKRTKLTKAHIKTLKDKLNG